MRKTSMVAGGAVLAAGATLLLGVAPAGAAEPFDGNGHSYDVVGAPGVGWAAARDLAAASTNGGPACPGYLATITSPEENAYLVSTFTGAALHVKWFGGIQPVATDDDAGWTWANGETWGYTNWLPGEPTNTDYGPFGFENATAFLGDTGHWNDAPASWSYGEFGGYVVEYDCRQIAIDIKPGSDVNSVQSNGNGVIPVAILTTPDFDAASVDPHSVTLDGQSVRVKGKSGNAGALQDVDGDGDADLVVQIIDVDGSYAQGDTVGRLSAMTYDGTNLAGTDSLRIVPAT